MKTTPKKATEELRRYLIGKIIKDIFIQAPNEVGTSGRLSISFAPIGSELSDTNLEVLWFRLQIFPVEGVVTTEKDLDWLAIDLITDIGKYDGCRHHGREFCEEE